MGKQYKLQGTGYEKAMIGKEWSYLTVGSNLLGDIRIWIEIPAVLEPPKTRATMNALVTACLLAGAAAFPQQRTSDRDAEILRQSFEMGDGGRFRYDFETSNGIVVEAAGENRQIGDAEGMVMRGSYSYTSPEGIDVTIEWLADETGFHAVGDQVPEMPEYVKQLLKTLPNGTPVTSQIVISSVSAAADSAPARNPVSTPVSSPVSAPVSTPVSAPVRTPSRNPDGNPESIQDAIASALREDAGPAGAGAPANPSPGDIAKKEVPSSEFIVLGA
ncbi:Pupal cuticle protein [Amphibalanus amphitrite]|uniref:Pupal cuticle protein n=1 Tax=Amphibalanus amphitrite TaxID=1232801 RepID=A0A6A4V6U2_AMPAM|nr:Pupal cuticle protein [Amphibalanus amphitrite]